MRDKILRRGGEFWTGDRFSPYIGEAKLYTEKSAKQMRYRLKADYDISGVEICNNYDLGVQ